MNGRNNSRNTSLNGNERDHGARRRETHRSKTPITPALPPHLRQVDV